MFYNNNYICRLDEILERLQQHNDNNLIDNEDQSDISTLQEKAFKETQELLCAFLKEFQKDIC